VVFSLRWRGGKRANTESRHESCVPVRVRAACVADEVKKILGAGGLVSRQLGEKLAMSMRL
jgi:hypothetical protein